MPLPGCLPLWVHLIFLVFITFLPYYIRAGSSQGALLPHEIAAENVGDLHYLPVLDSFAGQLSGEVGETATPAIFLRKAVQQLPHGEARSDDLRFDFVSDIHKIPPLVFFGEFVEGFACNIIVA